MAHGRCGEPLSRRSLVRGAALLGPAAAVAVPDLATAADLGGGRDAERRRGRDCAPGEEIPKLLKSDMSGQHAGRMHGVPLTYNWSKHPRVGIGNHPDR